MRRSTKSVGRIGEVTLVAILFGTGLTIFFSPTAAATAGPWSCNQSSCSWQGAFDGSSTPDNACSTASGGGSSWSAPTPTVSTGQVQLSSFTACSDVSASDQAKYVWGGMGSPSFTAWKATGVAYTITVEFLVIATLSAGSNCVVANAASSSATIYTEINTYDSTTGSNPDSVVTVQQAAASASCSGSTLEYSTTAIDQTFSQTSSGHFSFTNGDTVAITPDAKLQTSVGIAGGAAADAEYYSVDGITGSAYLTYISVS